MMPHRSEKNTGFTIIEVLVVLAIAGLILLVVFLAVPAVQRAQRNHFRKRMVEQIAAELDTYKSENSNTMPLDGTQNFSNVDDRCKFLQKYIDGNASSPCITDNTRHCKYSDGERFSICYHDSGSDHAYLGAPDEISIEPSHQCAANPNATDHIDSGPLGDTDLRRVVVWTKLEPNTVYCVDNALHF